MRRDASASPSDSRPFVPLRGRAAFQKVYRTGSRRRRGGIVIIKAPGESGKPQVGIVAGKNVGNAVRRNRAKRRIRAALERAPLCEDTAYVVIASVEATTVGFLRLVELVRSAVTAEE